MRIVETVLPLSPQHQVEFFKSRQKDEEDMKFLIDVDNSKLTPKQCLMMISNMKLDVDIKRISKELMKAYMEAPFIVESDSLAKAYANIMTGATTGTMYYKDIDDVFSIDDIAEFIAENLQLVINHAEVLNSIPLFLLMNSQSFLSDEKKKKLEDEVEFKDGKVEGVGVNFSQAVKIPEFLDHFLKPAYIVNMTKLPYYKYYFDEYIYGGDRLIRFLLSNKHQSEFAIKALQIMDHVKKGTTPYKIVEGTESDS